MTATNVNVTAVEIFPLGGATNAKEVLGWIDSAAKAAADDTWTVKNASAVKWAVVTVDANGIVDATTSNTVATNVITLTGATTGAHSGLVLFTKA